MPPSEKQANDAVRELAVLNYFPADVVTRSRISELLLDMCSTEEQMFWLVSRMTNGSVFSEWPGPHELRAVFCSKFRPADGIGAVSKSYPDGIPSERETTKGRFLPAPGDMPADDVRRAIAGAAERRALPAAPEPLSDAERAEIVSLQSKVDAYSDAKRRQAQRAEQERREFAEWQRAHEQAEVVR